MKVHVLVNAGAGTHETARGAIEQAFAVSAGTSAVDLTLEVCPTPSEIPALARRALAGRPDVLAAGGGDGTLSAVAQVLAGGETPLGVLPLGTLNHFARDARIPATLAEAVSVIASGHVERVDLGEVNGRTFLNNVSLGFYPDLVRRRERLRPRLGKWPALAVAAAVEAWSYPVLRVDVEVDRERFRRRVPLLFVGNNRYGVEWPEAGQRERLDEGCLTLAMLQDSGLPSLVRSMLHALRGARHRARDMELRTVRRVVVHARGTRLRVAIDGELVRLEPPLVYRTLPGALAICSPAPAPGLS